MATIELYTSYTDLEQSKKLAKILPLESADMNWHELPPIGLFVRAFPYKHDNGATEGILPCWSLSALLGVLPKIINNETLFIETSAALWHIGYRNIYTARADNPVDACVAMIEKLNELKML